MFFTPSAKLAGFKVAAIFYEVFLPSNGP